MIKAKHSDIAGEQEQEFINRLKMIESLNEMKDNLAEKIIEKLSKQLAITTLIAFIETIALLIICVRRIIN